MRRRLTVSGNLGLLGRVIDRILSELGGMEIVPTDIREIINTNRFQGTIREHAFLNTLMVSYDAAFRTTTIR